MTSYMLAAIFRQGTEDSKQICF